LVSSVLNAIPNTAGSISLAGSVVTGTLPVANGGTGVTTSTGTGATVRAATPSFTTTIGVGGATPSVSGAGITFPATQSASSDANTLDDYEEGTFTSTVYYNTSVTATSFGTTLTITGSYVKVGKMVQVNFPYIDRNGTFGGSNVVIFYMSLPFTVGTFSGPGILTNNYNIGARYTGTVFSSWITWANANGGSSLMQIGSSTYNQAGSGYITLEVSGSGLSFSCMYVSLD
jgi:hypothetical protein